MNQARSIVDIRLDVQDVDCSADITQQMKVLERDLSWFITYSNYHDTPDIGHLVQIMKTTTDELQNKVQTGSASLAYCEIKRQILIQQADIIGKTVSGSLQ